MGSASGLSAGAYTTTLNVMVDRVKGGGRAPSPGRADFSIMIEYTPESGHCHSVCILFVVVFKFSYFMI
jgi:hypothetical protein